MFRKCHQSKYVDVDHIPGTINPSGILTKEMKDSKHFENLRDSIMVSLQAVLKYCHNVTTHNISAKNSFSNIPYGCNTWSQTVYNSKQAFQNTSFQTF